MRQNVALYKNHAAGTMPPTQQPDDAMETDQDDSEDEAALEIPLEELIDELEALDMQED